MNTCAYILKISVYPLLFFALNANAQTYFLEIRTNSAQKISYKKEHKDSLSVLLELNYLVSRWHKKSYLLASIDSVIWENKTAIGFLYLGEKVEWAAVRSGNISPDLIRKMDYKERLFSNKPLKAEVLFKLEQKIINYCANNGFPFASIRLDSVSFEGNTVTGVLLFSKGKEIKFDSVKVVGNTKTQVKFLQNYLQIKPGGLFNQQKLDNSTKLLNQLRSIKITQHYQLQFKNDKAIVFLYLEDKKTNTVDGIGGFQQNPKDNKLLFTGQFDIGLNNVSGTGKAIEMHWKKTDVASQFLNLKYNHLSLFGSNIHSSVRFHLFKQDSSFIQRKPYWEFYYNHPTLGKLKFFYELDDSRTIGKQQSSNGQIPTFSSVKTNYYGLGIEWNDLDDLFFPREGILFSVNGSAGNKNIIDNTNEALPTRSLQLKFDASIEKHTRINQYFGAFTKLSGALLENKNLFLNELFRLGGIQNFRGFREYNFYASEYLFGTLEGRFYLDSESYLLAFTDYGIYHNSIKGEKPPNNGAPMGIGAGVTFSTKTGLFSFIYAVGKQGNNPVNFNNSVINFGLTSRF